VSSELRSPTGQDIREFYDSQTRRKLRDFIDGNDRVEAAWLMLTEWLPTPCNSVLEVGCGIGFVSWRIASIIPHAKVLGLDVSPKSVEIATRLFKRPNLTFKEQLLLPGSLGERFDCVLLMDVYEHIEPAARGNLHAAVGEVLSDTGRVVLSFPSPWMLAWQRLHQPEEIQPIDEQITWREIGRFAADIGREVLCLKSVNVWHVGDYCHAVLGRIEFPTPLPRARSSSRSLKARVYNRVLSKVTRDSDRSRSSRRERLAMVRQAFGAKYDPSDPSPLELPARRDSSNPGQK